MRYLRILLGTLQQALMIYILISGTLGQVLMISVLVPDILV